MNQNLQNLLNSAIEELKKDVPSLDNFSTRLDKYSDYKNKYMILKPSVKATIELKNGRVLTIDITDYFQGVQ